LKKCPACKSISPDEETTCGVCGASLEHVSPMVETLDQSALEDMAEGKAAERQFARKARKVDNVKLSVGLSVGLAVFLSGIVLIANAGFGSLSWFATGFLFLPLGLWVLASVALGGLGPSAWYRLWKYRLFWFWWNWISSEESLEYDEIERSETAENIEARNESDKSRRERRESGYDYKF